MNAIPFTGVSKSYDTVRAVETLDLEIGSGAVEGAVKNVIGKRCDHGGMRWIKERVEALIQLRCIEINGQWDAFIAAVHDQMKADAAATGRRPRLQSESPAPLPAVLMPPAIAEQTDRTEAPALAEAA